MLLTGELSLDGKAGPFLCPFYLERKATVKAANILMSASFVFSGYLRPLWSLCCQKCLHWPGSFFLADQLFCHRLWESRSLIWWTVECLSLGHLFLSRPLCFFKLGNLWTMTIGSTSRTCVQVLCPMIRLFSTANVIGCITLIKFSDQSALTQRVFSDGRLQCWNMWFTELSCCHLWDLDGCE